MEHLLKKLQKWFKNRMELNLYQPKYLLKQEQ